MTEPAAYSVRHRLVIELVDKIEDDRFPSATMLDMVESMLAPDELPEYAEVLMTKIRADRFPSIPLMKRLQKLARMA